MKLNMLNDDGKVFYCLNYFFILVFGFCVGFLFINCNYEDICEEYNKIIGNIE